MFLAAFAEKKGKITQNTNNLSANI